MENKTLEFLRKNMLNKNVDIEFCIDDVSVCGRINNLFVESIKEGFSGNFYVINDNIEIFISNYQISNAYKDILNIYTLNDNTYANVLIVKHDLEEWSE